MRRARRGVAQSTGFSRETQFRPPLPGEALDWPHEHWVRAAFSCGCRLSHRNREIGAASRTAESLRARRRDTPTAPALYQKRATAETARLRGVEAAPRAAQSHVRHFMWRRRRPRELRHLRGQRRRRRRQAAADARGFIKEAGLVGVRAQVRGRGHHGRASIRVPVPVRRVDRATRRSPPSPSCQTRSSTSSTCASSRNGSCGTTSRAPGCPTASRCGARRVRLVPFTIVSPYLPRWTLYKILTGRD